MVQGLYLGMQAMTLQMEKQNQIANNLANINTTGFKQSGLFAAALQRYTTDDARQPFVNREMRADEVFIDYSEGPVRKTGNTLDCMITGNGFFTVLTNEGMRYTRNGNFAVSGDGYLVTSDGSRVMGTQGFIKLDQKGMIQVNSNGEVFQNNETMGVIKITDFEKPYSMVRSGNGYFYPTIPGTPEITSAGYTVKQGYLEGSNASPIQNMADMINCYRTYEADQKALLAQDQTLDKAVNSLGKNS